MISKETTPQALNSTKTEKELFSSCLNSGTKVTVFIYSTVENLEPALISLYFFKKILNKYSDLLKHKLTWPPLFFNTVRTLLDKLLISSGSLRK